jgi:hypothetical protein
VGQGGQVRGHKARVIRGPSFHKFRYANVSCRDAWVAPRVSPWSARCPMSPQGCRRPGRTHGPSGEPRRPWILWSQGCPATQAGPDLTGYGGMGCEAGTALLERAVVRYMRLRGGLLIQINPREAWEARGGVRFAAAGRMDPSGQSKPAPPCRRPFICRACGTTSRPHERASLHGWPAQLLAGRSSFPGPTLVRAN